MNDWFEPRSRMEKIICGCIKSAIVSHGDINLDNMSSAAKRIYCQLKAVRREHKLKMENENGKTTSKP